MGLLPILGSVIVVVSIMLVIGTAICIDRHRLRVLRQELGVRLDKAAPTLLLLAGVLVINSLLRRIVGPLSWLIGIEISGIILKIEGDFVAILQSFETTELTMYFSFIYIYGYVFLLLFPLVAYFVLTDQRPLRELSIAYVANYGIGLICYLLFIAYGPRNLGSGEALMYNFYPQSKWLTSAVNDNINVFPSLHTSLSMTVMLFAWRTRSVFPRWLPIAIGIGISVMLSTMYLGIHWAIDVLSGVVLAVVSFRIGVRGADRWQPPAMTDLVEDLRHRV